MVIDFQLPAHPARYSLVMMSSGALITSLWPVDMFEIFFVFCFFSSGPQAQVDVVETFPTFTLLIAPPESLLLVLQIT